MLNYLMPIIRRFYPDPEWITPKTAQDYLFVFGQKKEALLYALLFLPNFAEVEGSILLSGLDVDSPEGFLEEKSKKKRTLEELEDSYNYVEISHVFDPGKMENLLEEDEYCLARCVAEAWRGRLALLYPNRKFNVRIIEPPESGDAYGVSFHEIR